MSGLVNQVGARSGILYGGETASGGTVTLSGITGLDYEEGTWAPTNTTGAAPASSVCLYTKIGRQVFVSGNIVTASSGTTNARWEGLPFTAGSSEASRGGGCTSYQTNDGAEVYSILGEPSTDYFYFYLGQTAIAMGNSKTMYIAFTYLTA